VNNIQIKKYRHNGESKRNNERMQYSSFNPEADAPEILMFLNLRKILPSLEILASVTSSTHSDSAILSSAMKTPD
jgi:hypothetical protein